MSSTPIVAKGGLSFEYFDFYIPWENAGKTLACVAAVLPKRENKQFFSFLEGGCDTGQKKSALEIQRLSSKKLLAPHSSYEP